MAAVLFNSKKALAVQRKELKQPVDPGVVVEVGGGSRSLVRNNGRSRNRGRGRNSSQRAKKAGRGSRRRYRVRAHGPQRPPSARSS